MTQLVKHSDYIIPGFESFDLLWKNLFNYDSDYSTVKNSKISYPVDIYETKDSLNIDIAIVDKNKEDIKINIEDDILNVSTTTTGPEERVYIHKGITKKDISLSWKVSDKFDLQKITASFEKGLLKLEIPLSKEKTKITKEIKIK